MLTNRNTMLNPQTDFAGRALTFDFPAFQIGMAEYPEGPTGCTVFLFPSWPNGTGNNGRSRCIPR